MSAAGLQGEQSHSGDGGLSLFSWEHITPAFCYMGWGDGPLFCSYFPLARGDKYWVAGHSRFESVVAILG